MFRDVPSIETPGVSVLDEYYWPNKHDPTTLRRAPARQSSHRQEVQVDASPLLALAAVYDPRKTLRDKKISDGTDFLEH